jgi:hypothetical protein
VTVDEEHVPNVLLDSDRPTDPGQHQVRAIAPGFLAATTPVTLTPGGTGSVTLKLEPDPNAAPAPSAAAEPSGAPSTTAPPVGSVGGPPPLAPKKHANVPAYVSLGVGGAGLIFGSVLGLMALGSKGQLDLACSSKICPQGMQGTIDQLNTYATLSSVGFGVGIAGAAVGVVLLVTGTGSSEQAPAPKQASSGTKGLRLTPWFGGNEVGVGGTFE